MRKDEAPYRLSGLIWTVLKTENHRKSDTTRCLPKNDPRGRLDTLKNKTSAKLAEKETDSITLGSHNIPFSDSARNLGFILDSKLSTKKHIIKICQTAYFELKRISSIRRFLNEDATKSLVTSYILSRLDYCNCLFMGTPNSVI